MIKGCGLFSQEILTNAKIIKTRIYKVFKYMFCRFINFRGIRSNTVSLIINFAKTCYELGVFSCGNLPYFIDRRCSWSEISVNQGKIVFNEQ